MLDKHRRASKVPFARADLVAWSTKFAQRKGAPGQALDHLMHAGLIRRVVGEVEGQRAQKSGLHRYQLTAEGMAAAAAAAQARKHALLSAAGAKASRPRDSRSFGARLWRLLRMRQTLTAPEAAETLVDAGGDVDRASATAAHYLRLWTAAHPQEIQLSKQQGARGAQRYVLVKDLGPVPPVTTGTKKARGGATQ